MKRPYQWRVFLGGYTHGRWYTYSFSSARHRNDDIEESCGYWSPAHQAPVQIRNSPHAKWQMRKPSSVTTPPLD